MGETLIPVPGFEPAAVRAALWRLRLLCSLVMCPRVVRGGGREGREGLPMLKMNGALSCCDPPGLL